MSSSVTSHQEQPGPRIPRDTFASRLVLLRHELELTVDEISHRCGIASATWSTWERGTRPRDKEEVSRKVADALGYDPHWLIFGTLPAQCEPFELIDGTGTGDGLQGRLNHLHTVV